MNLIMQFLNNLKLSKKLGILVIAFTLPIISLTYFTVVNINQSIDFIKKEIAGIEYLKPMYKIMINYNQIGNAILLKQNDLHDKIQNISDELKNLQSIDNKLNLNFINNDFTSINVKLTNITDINDNNLIDTLVKSYALLNHNISTIADKSNLSLDADIDSYYLITALTGSINTIGKNLLDITLGVTKGISIDSTKSYINDIYLSGLNDNYTKAINGNINAYGIEPQLKNITKLLDEYNNKLNAILSVKDYTNKSNIFSLMAQFYDVQNSLLLKSVEEAEFLLTVRVSYYKQKLITTFFWTIVSLIISGIIYVFIVYQVSHSISILQNLMLQLSRGEYRFDIPIINQKDEIGAIARSLEQVKFFVSESSKLSKVLDNLSAPIVICDQDFKIKFVNKAYNLLNDKINVKDKNGGTLIGTLIDTFGEEVIKQKNSIRNNPKVPNISKFTKNKEVIESHCFGLVSSNNEFEGAYLDLKNITEQVRNEQNINLAQDKIGSIIKYVQSGILDKRLDQNEFDGFYKDLAISINELMNIIYDPIKSTISTMQKVASGDLKNTMEGNFNGVFKDIQIAVNNNINTLKNTLQKVQETSNNISAAVSEIASGSNDLAKRTETQAASISTTTISMKQMTSGVQESSGNAINASKLSHNASTVAANGSKVVGEAISAMSKIENSSKKISEIITVIDEIAFQTNLLALNAAVEAARAGEAGKGFAVVATEVRSLAGRSSNASKQIKLLISESADHVQSGAALVKQSGNSLSSIIAEVANVQNIIEKIAEAAITQKSMINSVTETISNIDDSTQQNAALVEQNNAVTNSLLEQVRNLANLIQFFKV